MKLYIWRSADRVSAMTFKEGGILIVAKSEKDARKLAEEYVVSCNYDNSEVFAEISPDNKPDYVLVLDEEKAGEPRVLETFPDGE